MAPIVSFIGHSGSGKTTLIEKLVPELRSRGYRVATVKHTHHAVASEQAEKDSARHLKAGSEAAVLCSPDQVTITRLLAGAGLAEIARLLGEDYDIVLTEGFKQDDAPKIEVHRRETGPLLTGLKKLFAIVSDEPLETKTRQFSFDDVSALADILEEGFIKPQAERVSLYINGAPVTLKSFIQDLIANVLTGIAASLKGVSSVRSLEVFLRKKG